MGYLKYLRESWKHPSPELESLWKERLMQWRQEPVTLRIEHPTRMDRARSLGYKAKPGYVVVRQRVDRGGRMRPKSVAGKRMGGRRPRHRRLFKVLDISYRLVAEQRTAKQFPNCEVLNSYFVAQDGKHYWYEVILVDKSHPAILADRRIAWIAEGQHKGRVYRGLTSAGRRSRGLRRKGKGAEKLRPSRAAHFRRKQRRKE